MIGVGSIRTEYGSFHFNLGPGDDEMYHEISAVEMENVMARFGECSLKEIGKN